VLAGTLALLVLAWVGIYGHLWSFERLEEHRFTAKAILEGTWKLRRAVSLVENDEQIYDGGVYTNWGVGVPLLQAPFHALASAIGLLHGFFPDRAIFFFYAAVTMPVLWAAFRALFSEQTLPGSSSDERTALSWTATWAVLTSVLFPLTSTRFVIYEETIAYFVLFQLLAIAAYMFALRSWSYASVAAIGAATGVSLLVRATGLPYAVLWLVVVAVEGRAKKALAFLAALAPFAALWLHTNHLRTGTYLGLGYPNSTPAWPYNMPIERFGSQCSDTLPHMALGAMRLFTGFFLFVTHHGSAAWLAKCHFDFEERAGVLPFFGPVVLVLVAWLVLDLASRRERKLSAWAPYALCAVLFAAFVRRGMGFAWRYAFDFWPAVVVGCVQAVRVGSPVLPKTPRFRLAKILFWYGFSVYVSFLLPWLWQPVPEIVPTSATPEMAARFAASMTQTDAPLPSRVACGDKLAPIFQNGLGWRPDCHVDTFTNLLLGVPPKADGSYLLRAHTEGMPAETLRVYLNGTIYVARKTAEGYEAEVHIPYAALGSPIVVVTVEWTRALDPPPDGRLLSIELL
jgi:hypothetical protein